MRRKTFRSARPARAWRRNPKPAAFWAASPRTPDVRRPTASAGPLVDALGRLHARAEAETGADGSVLFDLDPSTDALSVASMCGVDGPLPPWIPTAAERRLVATVFAAKRPSLVRDGRRRLPGLARPLDAATLLLVPLEPRGRRGLLTLAFRGAAAGRSTATIAPFVTAFSLALELSELGTTAAQYARVREMLRTFSEGVSPALDLIAGLDAFCRFANDAFGAERTSVWLHERRRHELVLAASSDPAAPRDSRVPTTALDEPAARGLRSPGAQLESMEAGRPAPARVVVPLRGRRRALGTIVSEGIAPDSHSRLQLRACAEEIGEQLSGAVENVQLLQDVIRSRRELENTFNSIDDLVAVCDRQLIVAHVNRAFAERAGLSRESLLDHSLREFVGPEICQWMETFDLETASSVGVRETTDPVLRGTFSVTLSRLASSKGPPMGLVMVARDITEQARLEREQAALRARLTQSEKLAALGQFVAGIAHELNNPLQGVLGHIELLNATAALPQGVRRQFRIVTREAERAAKIVRNLLVFAGSGRLVHRRLSLNAVVSRAVTLRTESCRALAIDVTRTYDDQIPRLYGDPLLLQQAFLNILINAEHAVMGQPTRRIDISTRFDRTRRVAVTRLRDTGSGMAPDVLSRVFEPFFTTKDVGQGTGLGLAITYGIIQEHSGQISVDNHAEGGAVFTIELPIDKKVPRAVANSGRVRPSETGR